MSFGHMRYPSPVTKTYRVCLYGQNGCAAPQYTQLVLYRLTVEDGPAWQADDANFEAAFGQLLCCLQHYADLTAGTDEGKVFILNLVNNVATLECMLDRRVLEVGQILTGQAEHGRGVFASQRAVVRSGRLVAVGRAPNVDVGEGA